MQVLISQVIPQTLDNKRQSYNYEINIECITPATKQLQNTLKLKDDEVYISFVAPEIFQLDINGKQSEKNGHKYIDYWNKQVDMTIIAAKSILKECPSLKVIIIAIKIDDQEFDKLIYQYKQNGKTPDYLVTFHFQNGGEDAFDTNQLCYHSESNLENVMLTPFKTYYQMLEPGAHETNLDKSYGLSVTSISQIEQIKSPKQNTFYFVYLENILQFLRHPGKKDKIITQSVKFGDGETVNLYKPTNEHFKGE
ncbi:Hypothetical_protein [Hexamita inflata]|uniref:Hypothetical_protein n=1 Tax=Hexamita inflata TaxID=28002 RepID=A0AA86TIT0_9EUKA|nr:Hypothetical protein HINF_LOCUS6420 [Hexamita inflata]